jgi:hypothetical protein
VAAVAGRKHLSRHRMSFQPAGNHKNSTTEEDSKTRVVENSTLSSKNAML